MITLVEGVLSMSATSAELDIVKKKMYPFL